jgi:hypothetical protein
MYVGIVDVLNTPKEQWAMSMEGFFGFVVYTLQENNASLEEFQVRVPKTEFVHPFLF